MLGGCDGGARGASVAAGVGEGCTSVGFGSLDDTHSTAEDGEDSDAEGCGVGVGMGDGWAVGAGCASVG